MEILNRLQFVHCDTLFATCEEAKLYVESIHNLQRPTLYAEPMILKYGQEENPNILLAIGSVGNGSANMNNKTFFIDFNFVDSKVKELESLVNAEADDIANIKDILTTIKNGCGFTQDGEYITPENELLKKASSLANADVLLAEYIQALEAKTTLNVESTSSVELTLSKAEDGMLLSSDVVLAQNIIVDNKLIQPNIIVSTANGLFSNVQLDYQSASNALVFAVNGVDKTIALPEHINVVNGIYSTTTEEIILTMNNGDTVKIAMGELIREWTVKEDSNTPIVLKLEQVTAIDLAHGAKEWQDVLTADVRISDDIHAPFNILAKDQDGRSLRVDGLANKIQYNVADNQYISVQTAMDNINVDYNQATNVLTFNLPNNETKSIALNAVQLLDEIRYDADTEAIIIIYKDVYNQTQKISIPVSKLITEWTVGNNGHTVSLAKTRSVEGLDILTADVNVTEKGVENNIIEVLNNKLYVNGIAENIKYNEMTVKEGMDLLDSQIVANAQSVIAEKDRAEAAENKIEATVGLAEDGSFIKNAYNYGGEAKTIGAEISHLDAELKAANDRIVDNTNYTKQVEDTLKQVATDLAVESARAMAAEGAISGFVQSETIRALQAEDELREKIEKEVARATQEENDIKFKLDAEIIRAQTEEARLNKAIEEGVARDEALTSALNSEIARAKGKEDEIEQHFTNEVNTLKQDLADEVLRATKEETALLNKITDVEDELRQAIEDEKERAEAADEEIYAQIESLSGTVTTELGPDGTVARNIASAVTTIIGDATDGYKSLGDVEDKIKEAAALASAYKVKKLNQGEIDNLAESANIREAYKLVNEKDESITSEIIKIYKDSALVAVKLSTVDATWDETNKEIVSGTGEVALAYAYADVEGKIQVVTINVSEFLAESEFKDGLQVNENGEVSVKLAGDITESGQTFPNLLTCKSETDGQNGALGLHNIKTNATLLQKDIRIEGGPLDTPELRKAVGQAADGNYYFKEGMNIYTLLSTLFTQYIWPKPTVKEGSIQTSIGKPLFTLKNGATNISGTTTTVLEVGTKLTLSQVTLPTVENPTTARTCSEFTYGYKDAENKEYSGKTVSIPATNIVVNGNYTMSRDFTTFENTDDTATPSTTASAVKLDGVDCIVKEGSCSVKVTITGPKGTCTFAEMPSYYIQSNMGTYDTEKHISPTSPAKTISYTGNVTNNKTLGVKGYYKYFIGCTDKTPQELTGADIRALSGVTNANAFGDITGITAGASTTIVGTNKAVSNGQSIVIACPTTYKLATIDDGLGNDILSSFPLQNDIIKVQTGAIETDYHIYMAVITNGQSAEFKNVTLKKKIIKNNLKIKK